MIDKPPGKGTDPIAINYLGINCDSIDPKVVNLDAGVSSLRYLGGNGSLTGKPGRVR